MNNLRGRLGSTRQTRRGLGCDTDSSTNFAGQHRNRLICQIPLGFGHQDEPLVSPNINEVGRNSWAGQCGAKIHIYEIRNLRNPCVEKGMHTRSQQIFSSRSRMGKRESDAHVRGAAVAQRLRSDPFGGGETRHESAEASKIGGSMKSRHPASNLFYEKTTTTGIGH
jgi:hypothetical protein